MASPVVDKDALNSAKEQLESQQNDIEKEQEEAAVWARSKG